MTSCFLSLSHPHVLNSCSNCFAGLLWQEQETPGLLSTRLAYMFRNFPTPPEKYWVRSKLSYDMPGRMRKMWLWFQCHAGAVMLIKYLYGCLFSDTTNSHYLKEICFMRNLQIQTFLTDWIIFLYSYRMSSSWTFPNDGAPCSATWMLNLSLAFDGTNTVK